MQRKDLLYTLCAGFTFFFLYLGYESVRGMSGVLVQNQLGTQGFVLATALSPFGMFLSVLAYNAVLSHWGTRGSLRICFGFSILALLAVASLLKSGSPAVGILLFIVRETYVVIATEIVWSLLNSQSTERESRKIYGPISGLGSVGAILGGATVAALAHRWSNESFILATAATLTISLLLADTLHRMRGTPKASTPSPKTSIGLGEFKKDSPLLRLFIIVSASQVFATIAGIEFYSRLQSEFASTADQTRYAGYFAMVLNGLGLFLQFAFTRLIMSNAASGRILSVIPVLLALLTAATVFFPSLLSVSILLIAFKGIDYSIFRVAKEVLYIPLSYESRFRAKQLIDVFAYRASKTVSSGIHWSMGLVFGAGPLLGPALMVSACAAWFFCARGIKATDFETQEIVE
jgi:AAA family ATP:ADP antiporter